MKTHNASEHEALQNFISDGTPLAIRARYASLPEAAAQSDYGDLDRNIVVIDTETTGFSLNHDELTQIAAARMERGEITDWFITFVNPGKPIPEDVVHLTDIHDEDVADAPRPEEALAELVAFVGDAKLVAHNAEFDRNFTTKHPSGYPLLENTWIDSLDLARISLPRMKSHRLLDLVRAFGLPPSTHRADADVAATCSLFRILLAAVHAMPAPLVREIARMAPREQWPTSIVFEHFAETQVADCDLGVSSEASLLAAKSTTEAMAAGEPEDAGLFPELRPFSLRALRKERVGAIEHKPKPDADVLAADPLRGLTFPTADEVAQAFELTGLVGSLYPDFEPRVEQAVMARVRARLLRRLREPHGGGGHGRGKVYGLPGAGRLGRTCQQHRRGRGDQDECPAGPVGLPRTACARRGARRTDVCPAEGLHALSLPAPHRPPGGRRRPHARSGGQGILPGSRPGSPAFVHRADGIRRHGRP